MATEALGVLAHVAALGARLWRRDQPVEQTLVATDGSLGVVGAVAHRRHPHSPVEMAGRKATVTGFIGPTAVVGGHVFAGRVSVLREALAVVGLLTKSCQGFSTEVLLLLIQMGQRILV